MLWEGFLGMIPHSKLEHPITLPGIVIAGHGVASGSRPSHYPEGTLQLQIPHFKKRGLDLTSYYRGTINVDLAPILPRLVKADFTFQEVAWTDLIAAEHFSFSRAMIEHQTHTYPAWVYWPHPETKSENYQKESMLELITVKIATLQYGDRVKVTLQSNHFILKYPSK